MLIYNNELKYSSINEFQPDRDLEQKFADGRPNIVAPCTAERARTRPICLHTRAFWCARPFSLRETVAPAAHSA